ncbi:MAG: hypothetical protein ACR2O7_05145, partial [Parasphingorhabdus sp.]
PHAVVSVAPTYKVMAAVYKPQERAVALLIDGGVITLAEREAENICAVIGAALATRHHAISLSRQSETDTGKE